MIDEDKLRSRLGSSLMGIRANEPRLEWVAQRAHEQLSLCRLSSGEPSHLSGPKGVSLWIRRRRKFALVRTRAVRDRWKVLRSLGRLWRPSSFSVLDRRREPCPRDAVRSAR